MDYSEFAGKVVVVTGAASSQGEAEARLFGTYSAQVFVADIADGTAVAAEI